MLKPLNATLWTFSLNCVLNLFMFQSQLMGYYITLGIFLDKYVKYNLFLNQKFSVNLVCVICISCISYFICCVLNCGLFHVLEFSERNEDFCNCYSCSSCCQGKWHTPIKFLSIFYALPRVFSICMCRT